MNSLMNLVYKNDNNIFNIEIDINNKKKMDIVIKEIKRGGIKNMMKYYLYEIINKDSLVITIYDSSFVDVFRKHKAMRKLQFNGYLNPYAIESYSKLYRFGKPNYLDYITYISFYNMYVCDLCNVNKSGQRYKCMECFELDLCFDCHNEKRNYNKRIVPCPYCNKEKLFLYNKRNIYPRCSKIEI